MIQKDYKWLLQQYTFIEYKMIKTIELLPFSKSQICTGCNIRDL